jgi:uncharacterized protein (TIGR02001 family)
MKKVTRFIPAAIAASIFAASLNVAPASAEVSANVGFASEYYFRGILQKDASASAGLDYEEGGFYAGTWAADVGDGLEVDLYTGYGMEFESGFSLGLGFTGYYYTGEFDDTYEEINLTGGFDAFSFEYSVGEWKGFGAPADYTFAAVTYEADNGFYGTYGTFGDEADGDYFELGYGTEIGGFDAGVAFIFNSEELSDQMDSAGNPDRGQAIIFSLGKSFSF